MLEKNHKRKRGGLVMTPSPHVTALAEDSSDRRNLRQRTAEEHLHADEIVMPLYLNFDTMRCETDLEADIGLGGGLLVPLHEQSGLERHPRPNDVAI